jgi:signal peptidase II
MHRWTRWLYPSIAVIILDQLSKYGISRAFQPGDSLTLTSFFNLVLAYNTGAAFSMFAGAGGWQRVFFMAIALLAAGVILYLLHRHADSPLFSFGLSLVLGGAIGNLIDRIALGHVVDFIQLHAGGYYWPAFNVADSAITIGAVLLIWDSMKKPRFVNPTR